MSSQINNKSIYLSCCMLGLFVWLSPARAANEALEILNSQCVSCHAITEQTTVSLEQLWQKKGPDLSSAGLKYNREWLNEWLQNPVRIRPAGMFYGNHIKPGKKSDEIDSAGLVRHIKLTKQQAELVADELMTFKYLQALVKPGEYKPGKISMTMGEMMFDKFKGCLACHQIEPGYGGLSGPEVYTAAKRLQADYLLSFMRNPQAWNSKTFMPNKHLKEKDLQKLVHYLRGLSQEKL